MKGAKQKTFCGVGEGDKTTQYLVGGMACRCSRLMVRHSLSQAHQT